MITVAEPGSIFAGKYKIEKQIGSGGMGVILSATHMQLEQRVAIKLLTSDAATDPERVGRFSREAKAAARIHSEHVVRILDCGTPLGFLAGGGALIGGTVLYFTAPRRSAKPAAFRVVPSGGPSSAGLLLHATW